MTSSQGETKLGTWPQHVSNLKDMQLLILEELIEPIKGTHLHRAVLRLLGAKIGRYVCWLGRHPFQPYLIFVGDGTIIAPRCEFWMRSITKLQCLDEPIQIGSKCVLCELTTIVGQTRMGNYVTTLPTTRGTRGMIMSHGSLYGNNPAVAMKSPSEQREKQTSFSRTTVLPIDLEMGACKAV